MITGGTPFETTIWGRVKPILNVKYDDDIEPNISTMDGKMEALKEEPHQEACGSWSKTFATVVHSVSFPIGF